MNMKMLHPTLIGFSNDGAHEATKYLYYLQLGDNLYYMRWRSAKHYSLKVYINRNLGNFREEQGDNDNEFPVSIVIHYSTQTETLSEFIDKLQCSRQPFSSVLYENILDQKIAERKNKIDNLFDKA